MAAFAIKARIEGIEQVQAMLKNLTPATQRKVLRPALNAEGVKIRQAAKRNVPNVTGLLRKSLGKKSKTYTDGTVIVIVGPRRGFKRVIDGKPRNPVNYAHLVEFGTKPHFLRPQKTKGKTGKMHPGARAQKPITRAAESALVGAAQRMATRMAAEIEKLAAKGKLKTVN